MSRAERLYLYFVSSVSLSMWAVAAIVALRLILNGVGVGPQAATDSMDRDMWSIAIAVGLVGSIVWAIHWLVIERSVRPKTGDASAADPSVPERHSIIRSFYLASVMGTVLTPVAALAAQLAGRALADVLNLDSSRPFGLGLSYMPAFPSVGDDWTLSIIVVLGGIWAYHAWVRMRDVRQGPVITGAAAWVSRLYLYWGAFLGLSYVLSNAAAIVATVMGEVADTRSQSLSSLTAPSALPWPRSGVVALVAVAVWGGVWLGHWLYSSRLRAGTTQQSAEERASRVRLAYLVGIAAYGAITVLFAVASSLSVVFSELLDAGLYKGAGGGPLWYHLITPSLAAVFAGLAWWWHRRQALAEDADGPAGVSAARVAGYSIALVGLFALTVGVAQSLASIFGEWFSRRPDLGMDFLDSNFSEFIWKAQVSTYGALALVGLFFWIAPWLFAQRRRAATAADRALEVASSSRAYYLHSVGAVSIVTAAVALAWILYRYLRVTFGLSTYSIGSEISGPLGWLLVAAAVYAYHRFALHSDRVTPQAAVTPPVAVAPPAVAPPPPAAKRKRP